VGHAQKLKNRAATYLATLPFELQEDFWDLFDALAATALEPPANSPLEVEIHLYIRRTEREVVAFFFPLLIDYEARTMLVSSIEALRPA
jgi:hypothetical protein